MKEVLNFEELKANGEMTPIPGFSTEMYLCHCPSGSVYSLVSSMWMLQGAIGTGDRDENGDGKYLMTTLKGNDGKSHRMYLHEIVMSSHLGIKKSDWRSAFGQPLEVNHRSKDTKDCSIQNLELTSSKGNKATKEMVINKVRLSTDTARQLRDEFKQWTGSKVEWYRQKGRELGVTARSIQNIVLGYTYKIN